MIVYFVTLILMVIFCVTAEKYDWPVVTDKKGSTVIRHTDTARFFYVLAAALLIMVAGLRFRVGADYGAYLYGYQAYIDSLRQTLRTLDEPGYGLVALVSTKVWHDGAAAVFGASLITIGLALLIIYRYSEDLLLSTLLLVVMGFWHGSFNGVRQYLAAAVLFCGYRFLRDEDLLKWAVTVFIAFLFHRSAGVAFFMYFAVHRKVSLKNMILLVLLVFIALRSYNRIFNLANQVMEKDYSEANLYTSTIVNRLRVLSACVPAAMFLFEQHTIEVDRLDTFHLNLTLLHAAIRVTTMNSALLYRIGIYTTPFMALAIPGLLKRLPRNKRLLYTTMFVGMYGIMWWYELSIGSSLHTFHWIWER